MFTFMTSQELIFPTQLHQLQGIKVNLQGNVYIYDITRIHILQTASSVTKLQGKLTR